MHRFILFFVIIALLFLIVALLFFIQLSSPLPQSRGLHRVKLVLRDKRSLTMITVTKASVKLFIFWDHLEHSGCIPPSAKKEDFAMFTQCIQ